MVPATPIALFLREHAEAWRRLRTAAEEPPLGEEAQRALSVLRSRGPSFFGDLAAACGFDADQLQHAIGALVACGLATSDGFAGLRALVSAARGRPAPHDRRSRFAGRWTAVEASGDSAGRDDAVELQAWSLLRRYGVVFRRLLTRETNAATWRELARVYRRLEARGEIRSGRFVTGMSGEQFAVPEAVEQLREVRRIQADGALVTISAADPLNLAGIVTAGERIRTASRNRIVYRDGVPLAVVEKGIVRELAPIDPRIAADVSRALKTRPMAALRHPLAAVKNALPAGYSLRSSVSESCLERTSPKGEGFENTPLVQKRSQTRTPAARPATSGAASSRVEPSSAESSGLRRRIRASIPAPTAAPMAPIRSIGPTSSRQLSQGSVRVQRNSPDATATPAPINAPLTTESLTGLDVVWAETVEAVAAEIKSETTKTAHGTSLPFARIVGPSTMEGAKGVQSGSRMRRRYCCRNLRASSTSHF